MKTRSAKAKGQRATKELREALLKKFTTLDEDDINVVPAGVTGEDLWLSPTAQKLIPFCFEVKNQEALNIWAALKQSEEHAKKSNRAPAVVFKRNRSKTYVALTLEDFLELLST